MRYLARRDRADLTRCAVGEAAEDFVEIIGEEGGLLLAASVRPSSYPSRGRPDSPSVSLCYEAAQSGVPCVGPDGGTGDDIRDAVRSTIEFSVTWAWVLSRVSRSWLQPPILATSGGCPRLDSRRPAEPPARPNDSGG